MTPLLLAYIVVTVLAFSAYGWIGRVLALGTLALVAAPFLIATTGLAGNGTDDARRMLWILLGAWGAVSVVFFGIRRGL